MDGVATCAAVVLAVVFAAAGTAKARRPRQTASTFRDLRLPAPEMLARAVPVAELVVALLLLALPAVGALAALTMLGFFTSVLATRLRDGDIVPCGCFGSTSTEPISFVELVRNGFLGVAAFVTTAADGLTAPALEEMIVAGTAVAIAAMVLGLCAMKRDIGSVWRTTLAGENR